MAAGVARAGLFVGRTGRLAGGDRALRAGRRCCFGSGASPGSSATTRSTRSRTTRTTRWSGVKSSARRLGRQGAVGDRHLLRDRHSAVGRGDLVRAAGLAGAGWRSPRPPCISPTRCCVPIPDDGELALSCSARTASAACSSSWQCWSSGFPRARRGGHAFSPIKPARIAESLVERGNQPRAPPPPTPSMSAIARPACRCGSARSTASAAPKARRSASACSCGQRSATAASSDLSDEALAALVERCLAMAAEAPEDPFAGLAPAELLAARRSSRRSTARTRRARLPPSSVPARWRPEGAALGVEGVTNSSGAGGERVGIDHRAGDVGRIFRRLCDERSRLLRVGGRRRRRDDAARSCVAQREASRGPRGAGRNRASRRRADGRAAQPEAA